MRQHAVSAGGQGDAHPPLRLLELPAPGRVCSGRPCMGAWQSTLVKVGVRVAGGLQPYKPTKPLERQKMRLGDKQKQTTSTNGNEFKEIATDTCVYKRVLRNSADEPKDTLKDAAADASLPRTRSVKCYNCGYPEAAYFQAPTKGELGLTLYFICCSPTCGHRWRD
ncbi:hypothetical protein ACQJBY_008763 [Aegilops geniculata]